MKKLKLAHQRRPFFNVHTQRRYPKKAIENIRKFGISKYKKLERAGAAYDVREGRGYGHQRAIHPAQGKNVFLKQGKDSRFTPGTHTAILNGQEYKKVTKKGHPNEGKWVYRGAGGEEHMTWNELKERVKNPKTGKQPYKHKKGYLAILEDIRNWVKNKGGASKVYLSDVVEKFGDPTEDELARDAGAESRIEKALGKNKYKKLIKGGKENKLNLKIKLNLTN